MRKTIVLLALLTAAAAANAATLRDTVDRTFDVRPGGSFSLENTNGAVTINAWDQPRIRVVAERKIERGSEAEAKAAMAQMSVKFAATADRVAVTTEMPKEHGGGLFDFLLGNSGESSVTYRVSVPRSLRVDVDNTNGSVSVAGVQGVLKLGTTNGAIELVRCGGAVDLSTTNGRITAELLTIDPRGPNHIETTNGRVEVSIPSSAKASLDAETTNGRVESEIPVTTREMDKSALRGAMNGGGTQLTIRTTNGSISIHASRATS